MALNHRAQAALMPLCVWFLLNTTFSYCVQSDIDCLKSIQQSLKDPLDSLNFTWNFENFTEGSICRFTGIECWHPDESKVLSIHLVDMGLEGEFPRGLANCSSLSGLDLSNNKLRGNIPSDISHLLRYVTNLDLSHNQLSGEIPAGFANCAYLNVLKLGNNQLTGKIPVNIATLSRLKEFNVSNNQLNGQVPTFSNAIISPDSYANNDGLCGGPLPPCRLASKKKIPIGVIVGAAVTGATISVVLVLACSLVYIEHRDRKG